jgi:hypothetical protein
VSRRFTPYLFVSILTLGAAVGAGLSLAQGPNTYTAPTTLQAAFAQCSSQMTTKPPPLPTANESSKATLRTLIAYNKKSLSEIEQCMGYYDGVNLGFGKITKDYVSNQQTPIKLKTYKMGSYTITVKSH